MPAQYLDFFRHTSLSFLDIVLLVSLVVFLRQERFFGTIRSALTLLKIFIVFLGSLATYPFLAKLGLAIGLYKGTADAVSLLLMAVILFGILQWGMSQFQIEEEDPQGIARFSPYITGTLTFGLSAMWLITILLSFPFSPILKSIVTNSVYSSFSQSSVALLDIHLQQIFGDPTPSSLNVSLITSETITPQNFHFHTSTSTERTSDEEQLLSFINQQRSKKQLGGLGQDSDLRQFAKAQGSEIARTGYLSTVSSLKYTLYDRLAIASIDYSAASEIVINASSLVSAKTALQNIPDSMQIILNPSYSSIAVSVIDTGSFGKIFVLDFLRP